MSNLIKINFIVEDEWTLVALPAPAEEAVRKQAYMKVQEIMTQDAPWVPIAYAKPPLGFQKDVKGYQASPTGGEAFNTVSLGGK